MRLDLAVLLGNSLSCRFHFCTSHNPISINHLQLICMSRLLRNAKARVTRSNGVGTLAESTLRITQLLATISKDVGNALGCAPASLVAGTLVSVLETVQVSNVHLDTHLS